MRVLITALAMTTLLAAGPALAQSKAWDQKATTALVKEFVSTLAKVKVETRKTDNVASDAAREFLIEDLELLNRCARKLSAELSSGRDRTTSWPRANRCRALVARTRAHAKDALLEPAQSENIDHANELIAQIGEYYGTDVAAPPSE